MIQSTTFAPRPPARPRNPAEQRDTDRYLHDIETAKADPSSERGLVFEQQPNGSVQVLKTSGETSPDIGPQGQTDIPADAVVNNRVVMYVDGIHTTRPGEQQDITGLLESTDPTRTNVHQPVIGVHEGVGLNIVADGARIGYDFELLKGLQAHLGTTDEIQQAAYAVDPAVKSVHDEIRQSIEAGRDVQVVLHSGGGAETALALTLLQQEDDGKYAAGITQHVRVLAFAPAASPEDFENAGVTPQNLYYSGSTQDAVWTLFHQYVPPANQFGFVVSAIKALERALSPKEGTYHSPYYIMDHNVGADGKSEIQTYLDGGPGQVYSFT